MGRNPTLSNRERQKITKLFTKGKNFTKIGRVLWRDPRTIKKQLRTSILAEETLKDKVKSVFQHVIFEKSKWLRRKCHSIAAKLSLI